MGHQKEGYPIYSGIPLFANYIELNSANFPCENWHNLRYRDFGIKLNVRAGLSSDSPMGHQYKQIRTFTHHAKGSDLFFTISVRIEIESRRE